MIFQRTRSRRRTSFEAALKDIDDAINTDSGFLISNIHSLDPSLAMIGIDHHVGINGDITEDLGIQNNILETVEERLTPQISKLSPMVIKFEMGQVDKQMDCKNGKGGPKNCGGKSKNKLKPSNGPEVGVEGLGEGTKKGPTRGVWTRLCTGPPIKDGMDCIEVGRDPKRKYEETITSLSEVMCMEKKQRLEEETRSLRILMVSQLGSVEVVEQHRRVQ